MLDPVDTLPTDLNFPSLGWSVIAWAMEQEIRVLDGSLAGRIFKPTPSQVRFIVSWYRLREDGEFHYRGGAIRLARGSLKSPLGAFLAVCELIGPTRFDGWDKRDRFGHLLGKRAPMALIQMAAVSEAQVANSFRYVAGWTAKSTKVAEAYGLDAGKTQVFAPASGTTPGGMIQIVTSSAATVRGSRPTLVLADECSEWTDSNGGTRFYDVINDNAAKTDGSRVLALMNTWAPGSGSVAESIYDAWAAEEAGDVKNERPLLYWSREAPADTEWSDPESIAEALALVYEECPWINQKQILSAILSPTKPITSSMREFGNLIVSDLSSWVSKQSWDAGHDEDATLTDGEEIVMFCDPSETDDDTALVAVRVSDGVVFPLWTHQPSLHGPVDYAELDRQVILAFEKYRVLGFWSDVHPAEQLVKSTWADRYGSRLLVWATKSDPVAKDMRIEKRSFAQMAELTAAAIETGQLRHNGDPVLSKHVINTQRRPYQEFVSVGKGDRSRKIDGAVAMIGARWLWRTLLDSPEFEKRNRTSKVLVFR